MPHWLLELVGWTLGAGAVATLVLWAFIWIRVEQSAWTVPTLRLGRRLAGAQPPTGRVCVVVPAYNEERMIGALVRSLRAETYPQLSIVLALDRCTDGTAAAARAAIAGDPRFEIVEVDACPHDWAGKVHAVHAGVTRSRTAAAADFLLFADADTEFAPGCIAAALALRRHRELDLLSLLSSLACRTWFERTVQTSAGFELMRMYPLTEVNARRKPRPFANGQFMLFVRDAYEAIGGHAAVKHALLEDIELARLVDAHGRRGGVFLAAGLFHCRMYGDWAQFRRGWKRIYTEAANRKPRRLMLAAWQSRFLGTIFPLWAQACGLFGALVAARDPALGRSSLLLWLAATAVWLVALVRVSALARAPAWTAPLQLVGAWLTADVLAEAARDLRSRTPTSWGGREYDVGAPRPAPGAASRRT